MRLSLIVVFACGAALTVHWSIQLLLSRERGTAAESSFLRHVDQAIFKGSALDRRGTFDSKHNRDGSEDQGGDAGEDGGEYNDDDEEEDGGEDDGEDGGEDGGGGDDYRDNGKAFTSSTSISKHTSSTPLSSPQRQQQCPKSTAGLCCTDHCAMPNQYERASCPGASSKFTCRGDIDMIWSSAFLGPFESLASVMAEGRQPLSQAALISAADVTDIPATFLADPFLLRANGRWYIYSEIVNNDCQKGEIGLHIKHEGASRNFEYHGIILREHWHLSFPFVIVHKDKYFMTTSTSAGFTEKAIYLYVAEQPEGPYIRRASIKLPRAHADWACH